ncbi:TrkH family potassium uptake protein [bacterium]|nr:TrkH family potassium uptake protein [bacterium]
MNWLLLCRHLGLLGILVGGSMIFSLPWAFPALGQTRTFEADGFRGLLVAIAVSVGSGGILFGVGRREKGLILRKEALGIVGLGWLYAGLLGALPFLFSQTLRHEGERVVLMSVPDAIFESISGFTTTGASVLTHLESPRVEDDLALLKPEELHPNDPSRTNAPPTKLVPRCIMFWRSFTHWLGGMGIIVLFVAVLGQLGAGGKALMRREVPGPISEAVRPRVRETALTMWAIYVGLSFVLSFVYWLEGMTVFNALCHTFGTLATGGFSTWNSSLGHYGAAIQWTTILFMIFAGTNFNLYYLMLTRQHGGTRRRLLDRLQPLIRDPEYRLYLTIIAVVTLMLSASLWSHRTYDSVEAIVRHAMFSAVTVMTTTGYGTEDFDQWSNFCRALLLALMFIGGCAGSTGGGIKVVRFLLFTRILKMEIENAFRPNVVRPLRIAGVNLDPGLRHEVIVYFSFVVLIFVSSWLLLMAIEPGAPWDHAASGGNQLIDCASAVASSLNNIGPGLGAVGPSMNYAQFAPQSKLLLALLMLLGRLELFAILVLFIPSFWRTHR